MVKDLLAKSAQDGLLIVAREGSELTGFVGVIIHTLSEMPEYSDTWMTGDKIAETKFLVVAEGNRGREIGTALMDAVDAELVQRGICDHLISTIESNKRAIRFHESRGFCPTWLELLKQ
jgi:ribosomal protein S18 acetylase RimI-like enzyme